MRDRPTVFIAFAVVEMSRAVERDIRTSGHLDRVFSDEVDYTDQRITLTEHIDHPSAIRFGVGCVAARDRNLDAN